MDLVYNETRFFPKKKEEMLSLPLNNLDCTLNKYIIEKFFIVNSNYITRMEEYPFLTMNKTRQNISNEYLLKIHKSYEINGEYFSFQRKKINFLIFINKNEQKLKDLYAMLFYIINNAPHEDEYISVTIIITSYTYIIDFKPNCIFHDKPYHFFTDYCTQHKGEFEKFSKLKMPKFKTMNLNMYDVSSLNIMIDLDIKPMFLPQFIIYDKNYKILYKDNMFQETPSSFIELTTKIFEMISEPYDASVTHYFGKKSHVRISTFFDKIEKEIDSGKVFETEEEFNSTREAILGKCLNQDKIQKRGRTCKIYFVRKIQNLNYDLSNSPISKTIFLHPFVMQNSNNMLPDFLYGSNYIKYPKLFHDSANEYLNYTLNCARSYITNTQIKCDITFNTKKKISNMSQTEKRDFNVEYYDSFENYYVPLNFKILFRDKTKYFNINLFPRLNPEEKYKITFKDMNDKDREFVINEGEITILQYFREDLYMAQIDLSERLNHYKQKYPNIVFRYCMVILIPCDKLKNSIHYESIMGFLNSCKHIDEVLIFTYVINDFKELTKYVTNSPFIYVYDQGKQVYSFEVFQGDRKRIEEWFVFTMEYVLNKNKWGFNITKDQYKSLKKISRDFMELNSIYSGSEIVTLVLKKKKYFDNDKVEYRAEIGKWGDEPKLKEKVSLIQEKIKSIIGGDSSQINLV